MFDFVHEKKKVVQIVLALIILPFAFWGVDSYRNAGGPAPLAEVNGEKIGQVEFENALEQQRQRIRELAGASYDPSLFDKPEVKHSVLDKLVARRLLLAQARDAGLLPGDEQIAQVLLGIEDFRAEGKFDRQRYLSALSAQGMNQAMFESKLAQDIAMQRLTDSYLQNGYMSVTAVDKLIRLSEQQRTVSVMKLDAEKFMSQARVSDAEVAAYYEKNAAEFQMPERVNVEYVLFSAESLLPSVSVPEAEIKQYYDDHASEYGTQEQRQAAHILISAPQQADAAAKQAARAKAEEVLKQVKQAPAKFAALAKQYSQDPGSAANGGDLGTVARGAMVKPFEESVYSLKAGEVSGLVETDYGFHIIKLLALKPAKKQELGAVRASIEKRLKSQHAADRFAELASKFSDTVYEQSDTLKPAADLVAAKVRRGVWLEKGQAPAYPWTDQALQAVFSDEAIRDARNTAAIEVAPNVMLAARVLEHKPASARPLVEVSSAIRQKLQRAQANELAQQQGTALLERLQRGEKVAGNWGSTQSITRNRAPNLDPALVQAVFRAAAGKLPAYAGVANTKGGYELARIDAIRETGAIDEAKRVRYAMQLRQLTGQELLGAYLADARKNADITITPFTTETR